jgi:hypothetical protein
MRDENFQKQILVDFDSGQIVRPQKMSLKGLGPGAMINVAWTNNQDTPSQMVLLVREDNDDVLFTLGEANATSTEYDVFSSDGRFVASGKMDGTVTVSEIERVRQKLAERGLGWKSE